LDALDKPIGLPPSLLKKAEEIRLENGPERVEKSLEDVQMLASRAMAILTEVRALIIVINHFLIKFP
jgi:programmed cell death 6-interacting protein